MPEGARRPSPLPTPADPSVTHHRGRWTGVVERGYARVGELGPQAMAETDPRRMIARAVNIPYQLVERCGEYLPALISAAAVEPDAAKALELAWQRHNEGQLGMARKLHASGALRPGISVEDAHATLALSTWAPTQFLARERFGWDGPTWERWCVKLLTDALLDGGEPARV